VLTGTNARGPTAIVLKAAEHVEKMLLPQFGIPALC
jgi:hypothetical protein